MTTAAPRRPKKTVRATELWCSFGEHWAPDEAFGRATRLSNRRGRSRWCLECRRAWEHQPGECSECDRPTPSRTARFCLVHRSEHRRAVAAGIYFDRFAHDLSYADLYGLSYWTRERIIEAIQKWAREHDGNPPRARDWKKRARASWEFGAKPVRTWPTTITVTQVFGSWNAAIEAAGFTPRQRGGGHPLRKTCRKGKHPWVPSNIYTSPSGLRACRTCRREHNREAMRAWRKRKKEALAAA